MNEKHYAQVLIDGQIYTLGGAEEAQYLQKVASYINDKTAQLKAKDGFSKQSQEYQSVMIQLNIADDYFKAAEQARESQKQRDDMEKESYSLKHDLVTMQMKLENLERKLQEAEQKQKQAEEELLKIKAVQTASAASAHGNNQNFFSGNNGHR